MFMFLGQNINKLNKDKLKDIFNEIVIEKNLEKIIGEIDTICILDAYRDSRFLGFVGDEELDYSEVHPIHKEIRKLIPTFQDKRYLDEYFGVYYDYFGDIEDGTSKWKGTAWIEEKVIFIDLATIREEVKQWHQEETFSKEEDTFTDYSIFKGDKDLALNGAFWNTIFHEVCHFGQNLAGKELSCIEATSFSSDIFKNSIIRKDYSIVAY